MPQLAHNNITRSSYDSTLQVDAVVLGTDAAETYTVPANVTHLLLSATAGFWIRQTSTAAVPATEVTDGSAPQYIPGNILVGYNVSPGMVLSLIRTAGAATTITIGRYEV